MSWLSDLFGSSPERPAVPSWQPTPGLEGLPAEIRALIQQGVGAQVPEPAEYGVTSEALQRMLQLQPEQFQLPIEDLLQAQQAQQAIQQQDWLKQIRPGMAAQGQLESTYMTDLLGDFIRRQQVESLGMGSQLRMQEALENLTTQRWLPEYQAGVAGQLGALGGQRAQLGLQNIQLPFQTTVPAFQQLYGTGLSEAQQRMQQQMAGYQQEMDVYNQQKQSYDQMRAMLWQGGLGAVTGGLGAIPGLAGGLEGVTTGALGGLTGQLGTMAGGGLQQQDYSGLLKTLGLGGQPQPAATTRYMPQWGTSGFNYGAGLQ